MKTKSIVVETREIPVYEFSDISTDGNVLVMWMRKLQRFSNPDGETVDEILANIYNRYVDAKNLSLGQTAIALLKNDAGGCVEETGRKAISDYFNDAFCVDGYNDTFLIGHLTEPYLTHESGVYLFMYDTLDHEVLETMHNKDIQKNIKIAFADALNYAIEPYL